MRIAPNAFHLDPSITEERQIIRDVCRITHHSDEAYAGALAIVIAIRSSSPSQLLANVLTLLPDSRVRDRIVKLDQLPNDLIPAEVASQFGSSGYVVESVPLALYAARQIDRFPFDVVLRNVIEAGGDTDTIASMTGQITGGWIGASNIPQNLIKLLPRAHEIDRIVDEFAATV